jgi:protein SCO1
LSRTIFLTFCRVNKLAYVCVAASIFALGACTDRAAKLPNYGPVPEFSLNDSHGSTFRSQQLAGKVWLVDFIYTHCPGPCPMMTAKMRNLEKKFEGEPGVDFVSISVDPDRDTPALLNEFAQRFGGPKPNWFFLTGSPETIHLLAHDVFKIGDLIAKMDHSTKFMLVDKRGNLRGYYSSLDPESADTITRDMNALMRAKVS